MYYAYIIHFIYVYLLFLSHFFPLFTILSLPRRQSILYPMRARYTVANTNNNATFAHIYIYRAINYFFGVVPENM